MLVLTQVLRRAQHCAAARHLRTVGVCLVAAVLTASIGACSRDTAAAKPTSSAADSVAATPRTIGVISPDTAERTLTLAAGMGTYVVDASAGEYGTLSGDVESAAALPADTIVSPDRDSTGCTPFLDLTLPRKREARNSSGKGEAAAVGNAVVWLVGVTHGPRDASPRRVSVLLDKCHIEPRISVAAAGATIIARNGDDMITRLSFTEAGRSAAPPRAVVGFTDPGQVVPSSIALASPGLVQIQDEHHAWVRAFIAVAPHPFVAVTDADGSFTFEGVPVGSYQLVVWHERLGARVSPVKIESGANTVLKVSY